MRLEIEPGFGGAVTGLWLGQQAVLRPTQVPLVHPFDAACFAMVPYANRIGNGRLRHGAVNVVLAPNIAGEAHPLHGIGLGRAWTLSAQSKASLELSLVHAGDASWPWPFTATQHLAVHSTSATMRLHVRNDGHAAMPLGMGFHPCFPDAASAELTAITGLMYEADAQQLPTGRLIPAARRWSMGAALRGDGLIDHCHSGWNGSAQLRWMPSGRVVRLSATAPLRHLHIYAALGNDAFCIEPVTHAPDAFNARNPEAHGMITLMPNESRIVEMRLDTACTDD